jgi:hypothetical protein
MFILRRKFWRDLAQHTYSLVEACHNALRVLRLLADMYNSYEPDLAFATTTALFDLACYLSTAGVLSRSFFSCSCQATYQ